MELQTISQVSKALGISAQMIRYYERSGLVQSLRKDGYAYRVYNEENTKRLHQIVIFRKLQIPMKQIKNILNNQNAAEVIDVFQKNIIELDEQITAMSTVRNILTRFVSELQEKADVQLKLDFLNEKSMISLAAALSFSENKIKERLSMEELNKASEALEKANEKKPMIFVYQTHKDEFYYLGKEYPRNWHEYMNAWDDFDNSGGWKMVEKYRNNLSYQCTVVNHLINPAGIYMAGTFVDEMTDIPEGFTLIKFPAYEYLVVTHEWLSEWDMFIVEEAVKKVQIPDGYVKYDAGDSQIRLIEVENNDPEMGSRWENWIPIRKI